MRFTYYQQQAEEYEYQPKWKLHIPEAENETQLIERENYHYRNWVSFSESPPKKDRDTSEWHPIRYGNLILDFDDKDDLGHAQEDAQRLVAYLAALGVSPDAIMIYYSGSKGFHIEIPSEFLGMEDGHEFLPLIYKRLVKGWIADAWLETVDLSIYCMGRGKMIRLPNRLRANGRYKVPITQSELFNLTPEEIARLGEAPREIERSTNISLSPVIDLSEITVEVEAEQAKHGHRPDKHAATTSYLSPELKAKFQEVGLPDCFDMSSRTFLQ
jgi:hypothetical protein